MSDAKEKARNEKLLALHQELLYPAFLGAVLFELARKIIPGLITLDCHWFFANSRWLATALWFVLYFSVAFLALHTTAKTTGGPEKFGRASFFANLVEIAVILLVSVAISLVEDPNSLTPSRSTHDPELQYRGVFLAWMLIPITAAVSNHYSGRPIHCRISIVAGVIGGVGLLFLFVGWKVRSEYWIVLAIMYSLLLAYYSIVFRPPSEPKRWWG
jgi:uncharacterized membrane protein